MATRSTRILAVPVLLLLAAGLAGCRQERPDGTSADWLEDARALESDGQYFQENRENAPLGALEYYELCLADGTFDEASTQDIRHKIEWLRAVKLMLAEGYLGEPEYREAIEALTAFREHWPASPHYGQALFFRAVAREYDIDYQDAAAAVADYELFIAENPASELAAEARVRIGHCWEFNLDKPDYAAALEAYDAVIDRYGPTNADVRQAAPLVRMSVERAIYYKARILDDRFARATTGDEALPFYQQAAACYERLTDDVFFGKARFRQSQFVHYRLGCILAEQLGRTADGLAVLEKMAQRWRESPWYGRVKAKMEAIRERHGLPQ